MTEPIVFESQTPRLGLPLLFAGQAQKEIFVNEALVVLDALLHGAIEAITDVPPGNPIDGQCWLVTGGAVGEWSRYADNIACRQSGQWLFVPPRDGMRLFNRTQHQELFYAQGWKLGSAVQEPNGGSTVDTQARAAIAELISALTDLGLLPAA